MDIGVAIVTYNRLEKLKIALKKYENQTILPKYIIAVNNNSNDGTKEFLNEWVKNNKEIDKYVINLEKNTGGSGGFYTALKEASNLDANWIWISDDDAFPEKDAIEKSIKNIEKHEHENISAICGQVLNLDKIDIKHRRRLKIKRNKIKQEFVNEEEYKKEYFYIDLFSYVGTIINKEKLKKAGLTKKDYFIFYDDTEHSYRLSKEGKIICVPSIKIHHDETINSSDKCTWKDYYSIRNKLDFYKTSFSNRYYKYEYNQLYIKNNIKTKIKKILNKNIIPNELINKALQDSKEGRLGLDSIYKPGWKCE